MKMEEQKMAYVFAPSPGGEPMLAGKLELTPRGSVFNYDKAWVGAPWGYPLDPVNLPLNDHPHHTTTRDKVPGVFLDAAPDSWGERVLLLQHKSAPRNIIEKLLRLSGAGVGGIQFSLSRSKPKSAPALPSAGLLSSLAEAARDIDGTEAVPDSVVQLIAPGSLMGGARPKVTIEDKEGFAWITKFSRETDVVNYPVVEYATMSLMATAGIEVPDVDTKHLHGDRHCYLIKRFDRVAGQGVHFVSAHALFNVEKQRDYADATKDPASYVALARILFKKSSSPAEDAAQLFRRMVFNIIIGNTDDHARNHALLFNVASGQWRLSPAYDVLPIVARQGEQSLGVGLQGRRGTIDNALSVAREFGLSDAIARNIVGEIVGAISNYRDHFQKCGVTSGDLQKIGHVLDDNLWLANDALRSL